MKREYVKPIINIRNLNIINRVSQLTMSSNYGAAVQNSFSDNGYLSSTKLKTLKLLKQP